ncbi:MAG: LytTR family DNA-binding domain-containing protein [Bacteroidota bacterium]
MHGDIITAVIVEDEKNAREVLSGLVNMYCPHVSIEGCAKSVSEGVRLIKSVNPDLIFLDIQLGKEQSFDLLKQLPKKDFHIVFVTAYAEHAVEAFRFSAIDYLLKPLDPDQLLQAVKKVSEKISEKKTAKSLTALAENLMNKGTSKKLVLSTQEMVHVVEVNKIVCCSSSQSYTSFYLLDKTDVMVSKTLKTYEELLSQYGFFRIHKSWLINTAFIRGYDRSEGGFAIMENNHKVPVSAYKKDEFLRLISSI